jgi:MHS family proline/betaine transporter-like MFS transporter
MIDSQPASLTLPPQAGAAAGAAPAAERSHARRAVVAAAIGNGLEMYDFTVYSFFAATIGRLFFPSSSPLASLMLSFATFGAGFVMRPLGAVLIGHFADRRGRKAALTLTIGLMTAGTALIAFAPTHASIGLAATVIVVMGRLLQGLSAGGEIGAASALLMESASKQKRCFLVSWQGATQGGAALAGALTGAAITAALSPEAMMSWGWRIPFMIGLLIAPVGLYIRRNLKETHTGGAEHADLKSVFRKYWRVLLLGMLLMTGSTSGMYITVFYMPTYLIQSIHMPPVTAFLAACMAGLAMLVMSPLFGKLADRLPTRKPMIVAAILASLAWCYPNFLLLTTHATLVSVVLQIGLSVTIMSISGGAGAAMMMEAFPREHRATGMSVMYSLGVTVFGGFAPLVVTWLIATTGSPMAPAWYLMSASTISLIALSMFPSHPGRD